jgi:hypothetical protein
LRIEAHRLLDVGVALKVAGRNYIGIIILAIKHHSQLDLVRDTEGAEKFLEEIFRKMWVAQAVSFMIYPLRKSNKCGN